MAARFVHRLGDQRGQDVVEYAGVLVLVAALVAAVASLGLGAKIARAATCEIQQIEQNSGCSAAPIGSGGGSVSAARSTAEAHSVGHRQHQQAVHMHTAAASRRVPTALAKLQHDAVFFRTGKGSLVALALARKIASQACDANDGDMLGPSYLCSAGQYTSNELAVYHALQNGRNIGGLSLTEPSFDTSVGFWNPVTLLTSVAAGPVGDLITNIAGTLTKDGIQQAGSAVAGLLGKQELTADASLQQTLAASGDLPQAQQSVWSLGWSARGLRIEQDLGGNLPRSFPTIDRFDGSGIATSIKSVDLTAPSYQSGGAVLSRVRGYINKVASFRGATWNGRTVSATEIKSRALDLAIPEGEATPAQQAALAAAEKYGASKGVNVKLIQVP